VQSGGIFAILFRCAMLRSCWNGLASVSLAGADGKERIRLQVTADGKGSIVFLDTQGKVIQQLAPAK
jgi:hypothetical protein